MQLSFFQETHVYDSAALADCLQATAVAVDIETETRWPGHGPKLDYGLTYSADVTVIALAWEQAGSIRTTAIAAPFDDTILAFVKTLFERPITIIAHNAVFDMRQLSKLTGGKIPHASGIRSRWRVYCIPMWMRNTACWGLLAL